MIRSSFKRARDEEELRLTKLLVQNIAGLSEETDPDNAAIALDFCLGNFREPPLPAVWHNGKERVTFFEGITEKFRVHTRHAEAERMDFLVQRLYVSTDHFE